MDEDDRELDRRLLERFGLVPTAIADAGDLANRGGGLGDLARREWAHLAEDSGAYVRDEDGGLVRDPGVALPRIRQEPDLDLSAAELTQRGDTFLAYARNDEDLADRAYILMTERLTQWAAEKAAAWAAYVPSHGFTEETFLLGM